MNKPFLYILILFFFLQSCKNETSTGKFTISGEIKNVADQQIFLEQLYFSQKNPEILDTARMKNGIFSLSSIAAEEGLYRLRLEKQETGYIFINDQPDIKLRADIKDSSLLGPAFNSPANSKLKALLLNIADRSKSVEESSRKLDLLKNGSGNDSLIGIETDKLKESDESFKNFIIKFIDTTSDPVVAMFALGYTRNIDPVLLNEIVPNMSKRFPDHQGIASIILQYNQLMAQRINSQNQQNKIPQIGHAAPDFTLNDPNGSPVSLNQLKGKYVLVDFWASWCGPCRRESPFLTAAFNKFKDKNFTILGVSLDDDKTAWQNAILEDKLVWQQLSDLKGMGSPTANLYGIEAIPYNFLLDPQGMIIATELRGNALELKLEELLK